MSSRLKEEGTNVYYATSIVISDAKVFCVVISKLRDFVNDPKGGVSVWGVTETAVDATQ